VSSAAGNAWSVAGAALRSAANAAADLVGAALPLESRDLLERVDARLADVPAQLNEYGYDPWGLRPESLRHAAIPLLLLYERYFRVSTHGIQGVPEGPVLLIANHAGQLPFDALMIATAMLMEAEPPRLVRGMAEYWLSELPFASVWAARGGGVAGTPQTCREMLDAGEAVLAFPEGVRGMNKVYAERYRLQRFGTGFMRLALETRTSIVPVAVVGSEEQQPGLANATPLAKLLNIPAFPITPTFPWLGPLGLLPFPVKYRIYFGSPMHFQGSANEDDAATLRRVDRVRAAISELLERGRRERQGVFR